MKQKDNHRRIASGIAFIIFFMSFLSQSDAQTAASTALRLIGTIEGNMAGAVFQDTTGQQSLFHLQEKLPDGSQIVKVRSDSILLRSVDGISYDMFIARDTKTISTSQPVAVSPAPHPDQHIQDQYTQMEDNKIRRRSKRPMRQSSDDE